MTDETKFPESFGYKNWTLQTSKVNDWFKRCMADAPTPDKAKLFTERNVILGTRYTVWKAKWFSQFEEEF